MGSGTVVTAHCTCMAGMGEVCSHIGAVLFKVEAFVRLGKESVTCYVTSMHMESDIFNKALVVDMDIDFNRPKRLKPTTLQKDPLQLQRSVTTRQNVFKILAMILPHIPLDLGHDLASLPPDLGHDLASLPLDLGHDLASLPPDLASLPSRSWA
ncbi:hypothetical protein EMCRGX_G010648 [Ephydatia muelleri]